MNGLQNATSSLYGAYRLACMDAGGLRFFDASLKGFWRSFSAAVIVAPFYAILLGMRYGAGEVATPVWRYAIIETIAYIIAWLAFPVLMESLSRGMDRRSHYLGYIVAYNWAGVLQNSLYLPLAMLSVTGTISPDAASFFSLAILSAVMFYTWFITKTAMAMTAGAAAGVIAMDFALSLFINAYAESLL